MATAERGATGSIRGVPSTPTKASEVTLIATNGHLELSVEGAVASSSPKRPVGTSSGPDASVPTGAAALEHTGTIGTIHDALNATEPVAAVAIGHYELSGALGTATLAP